MKAKFKMPEYVMYRTRSLRDGMLFSFGVYKGAPDAVKRRARAQVKQARQLHDFLYDQMRKKK